MLLPGWEALQYKLLAPTGGYHPGSCHLPDLRNHDRTALEICLRTGVNAAVQSVPEEAALCSASNPPARRSWELFETLQWNNMDNLI